jgi:hypothetical protein
VGRGVKCGLQMQLSGVGDAARTKKEQLFHCSHEPAAFQGNCTHPMQCNTASGRDRTCAAASPKPSSLLNTKAGARCRGAELLLRDPQGVMELLHRPNSGPGSLAEQAAIGQEWASGPHHVAAAEARWLGGAHCIQPLPIHATPLCLLPPSPTCSGSQLVHSGCEQGPRGIWCLRATCRVWAGRSGEQGR